MKVIDRIVYWTCFAASLYTLWSVDVALRRLSANGYKRQRGAGASASALVCPRPVSYAQRIQMRGLMHSTFWHMHQAIYKSK